MSDNRDFLNEIQDKIRKRSKGLYFNKKTYSYKKNLTIITLLILLLIFVLFVYYHFFSQRVENLRNNVNFIENGDLNNKHNNYLNKNTKKIDNDSDFLNKNNELINNDSDFLNKNINTNKLDDELFKKNSEFKNIKKITTDFIYYIKIPENYSEDNKNKINQIFSNYNQKKIENNDILIMIPKKEYSSIMKHLLLLKIKVESKEIVKDEDGYFQIIIQK
ncbi:hypothetical protein JXR93_08190 [bacterium]|nr:hypothetical protein [bacterium]